MPFFAANGYRRLVVDLPGFYDEGGGSGWGAAAKEDFDTITEMLSDELERLLGEELERGERVTLFLHDWGCGYGQYLQHRYPERHGHHRARHWGHRSRNVATMRPRR